MSFSSTGFVPVCAQAPQNCRCLKGPLTGPNVKELGIQADTSHQGFHLNGEHILLLHGIHQQFRHQLRSGGGIGLVEIDHHRIDIVRSPTVMVHHTDFGNGFQQGFALHLVRSVGINHNQNAPVVSHQKGILSGNKNILVMMVLSDLRNQILGGVVLQVHYNVDLFSLLPA